MSHAFGPRALGEFALHFEFAELRAVVGVGNRAGTQAIADAERNVGGGGNSTAGAARTSIQLGENFSNSSRM